MKVSKLDVFIRMNLKKTVLVLTNDTKVYIIQNRC